MKEQGIFNNTLSKENILKHISEYDIYNYYLGDVPLNSITHSPFRRDAVPSFGVYYGKEGNLMFNDFKLGAGNVFTFVMWMENVSYPAALSIVNRIFNLGLYDPKPFNYKVDKDPIVTNYVPSRKESTIIRIKTRKIAQRDIDYFNPVDIHKMHRLYPIEKFWLNAYMFTASQLAYAYRYDRNIYKIYQPLDTDNKWFTNISPLVTWYGDDLLPERGKLLIVTSSNKDASVLHQIGLNAISPHTEAQMFSQEQYDNYSSRFDKIIIFYDNDETGILKAENFCNEYDLTYIALEEEDTKDPFEFVKKYDLEALKDWISQYI